MSAPQLTSMLNLAHQALQRADTAAIVSAPTEELAALLIAAARIGGWQAEMIVHLQRLDPTVIAEVLGRIRATREAADDLVRLATTPHEGEA